MKCQLWSVVQAVTRTCALNKNLPAEGLEPTRPCGHWILSPARLPIPPRRQIIAGYNYFRMRFEAKKFARNSTCVTVAALYNLRESVPADYQASKRIGRDRSFSNLSHR